MTRSAFAATTLALTLSAGAASAQGFSGSRVIPGSFPQVPIPGTLPQFGPNPGFVPVPPIARPPLVNGWFGGGFYPWYFSQNYFGSGFNTAPSYTPAPSAEPVAPQKPQIVPGNVSAAVLTVQLPLAGELWVNGVKQDGTTDVFRVTTSPIARGLDEEFVVKATWVLDGKKYASERSVLLGSGDRVKLTIASGDPVEK